VPGSATDPGLAPSPHNGIEPDLSEESIVTNAADTMPTLTESTILSDNAKRDQDNRLWGHALHLDNALVQRNNVYLVAQSVIVGAFSVLTFVSETGAVSGAIRTSSWIVGTAGALFALLWLFVNRNQWRYLRFLRDRCIAELPEYRATQERRPPRTLSPGKTLTYALPLIFTAMWVTLLLNQTGLIHLAH
jgi:hypothetical protein